MLKPVIIATAVLAIAGSSLVYAQQRFGEHGGGGGGGGERGGGWHQHYRPSAQDAAAFADARIAALKAGLQLTPDQEKNWGPFEQAVRDMIKLRMQWRQAREGDSGRGENGENEQGGQNANPFNRLDRRASALSQTGAALKKLADTGAPLYASLDDAQKNRFRILARMLRPHRMMARNESDGWGQGGRRHGGGEYGRGQEHGGGEYGSGREGEGGGFRHRHRHNDEQGSAGEEQGSQL